MAGVVVNNHVKMEWLKEQWLSANKGKVFCCAAKTYDSTVHGTLDVFFRPDTAFLWISNAGTGDEDFWNSAELYDVLKGSFDGTFPMSYNEYVPIIESGETDCTDAVLERYGLVAAKADIEKRLKDLEYYGGEDDMQV